MSSPRYATFSIQPEAWLEREWEKRGNNESELMSKAFLRKYFAAMLSRETIRHKNSIINKRKTRVMAEKRMREKS